MITLLNDIQFPEGPAFDVEGYIWLVEKEGGNLIKIEEEKCYRYFTNGAPNGIAIDKNNLIWFCDSENNSLRTFEPTSGTFNTFADKIENVSLKGPNDLAFDQKENLLFTCPGDNVEDGTGYICCITHSKEMKIVHKSMFYPNGLALSGDNKNLYVAETGTHFLWKFDWNPVKAVLSNPRKWVNVGGPVGPDGIAIDEEGYIYIAVYGSGSVKKVNSDGKIIESIKTHGLNPTNCAIDPNGKKGIIITEAEKGTLLQMPSSLKGIIYPFN